MKAEDDMMGAVIGIIASATIITALIFSVFILVPVGIIIFLAWLAYRYFLKSPAALERKEREHTQLLYAAAKRNCEKPKKFDFCQSVLAQLNVPEPFVQPIVEVAIDLYDLEGFSGEIPPPPASCNSLEGARYRDYLSTLSAKSNPGAVTQMAEMVADSFRGFLIYVPPTAESTTYSAPLSAYLAGDLGNAVSDLVAPYFRENHFSLFKRITDTIVANQHEVSGVPLHKTDVDKLINPSDYEGDDVVFRYLKDTPFPELFDVPIPVDIPEKIRFEHSWCIGPPGTGKTQLIQYLVSRDLEKVQNGEASVMVMDSAGDLIENISRLKLFAEGEPLHGKLIVIRPDLKHPPALNLFDMGRDRHEGYDEANREKMTNTVIDQLTYVLDAMLGEGASLTTKQETLYRYIIRLLMVIPEANLDTFTAVLQTKDLDRYEAFIGQLPKPAQAFFRDQFLGKEFAQTKDQLAWRLARLRENTFFDRMFSHSKSRLDLFTELNESKVLLIHTDMENLTEEGTNVFGRYFIGALLSASQERASLAYTSRLPVYCYIDEAQDYIAHDTKIARLLDQARKMNVGMFLAHQRTSQINDRNVLDALANTAMTFANTKNPNDLPLVSKAMRTTPDFIANQPKGHFAVSARMAVDAFSFKVPFFVLEEMDRMDGEQRNAVAAQMRKRYCAPQSESDSNPDPDTESDPPPNSGGPDPAESVEW